MIEQAAREEGIQDDARKDRLGTVTREPKARGLTTSELVAEWRSRLAPEDLAGLVQLRALAVPRDRDLDPTADSAAIDHAVSHCFERRSVVTERAVYTEALKHSVGRATPGAVATPGEPGGSDRGDSGGSVNDDHTGGPGRGAEDDRVRPGRSGHPPSPGRPIHAPWSGPG